MNLTVRRRPLTLEAQNRSQVLFVKIVVCKVALRQVFFRVLRLSTVSFISPVLQCLRHLYVSSKRKKGRNLRNFQEPMFFSEMGSLGAFCRKVLLLSFLKRNYMSPYIYVCSDVIFYTSRSVAQSDIL